MMNIDVVYIQDLSSEMHNVLKNNQLGSLPIECKNFLLRSVLNRSTYKSVGICFIDISNLQLKTYLFKKELDKIIYFDEINNTLYGYYWNIADDYVKITVRSINLLNRDEKDILEIPIVELKLWENHLKQEGISNFIVPPLLFFEMVNFRYIITIHDKFYASNSNNKWQIYVIDLFENKFYSYIYDNDPKKPFPISYIRYFPVSNADGFIFIKFGQIDAEEKEMYWPPENSKMTRHFWEAFAFYPLNKFIEDIKNQKLFLDAYIVERISENFSVSFLDDIESIKDFCFYYIKKSIKTNLSRLIKLELKNYTKEIMQTSINLDNKFLHYNNGLLTAISLSIEEINDKQNLLRINKEFLNNNNTKSVNILLSKEEEFRFDIMYKYILKHDLFITFSPRFDYKDIPKHYKIKVYSLESSSAFLEFITKYPLSSPFTITLVEKSKANDEFLLIL